jgi:hypothetical protein
MLQKYQREAMERFKIDVLADTVLQNSEAKWENNITTRAKRLLF